MKQSLRMDATNAQTLLEVARTRGLIRTRDLEPLNIPRVVLTRLVREGRLERVARGLYALPQKSASEHQALLEVAVRVPRGIFCLLTALRFHELTTQSPFEVWLAKPNNAARPRLDYAPLHIVHFSGLALTEGVEQHVVSGTSIRVYGIAKTVADCFKFRNRIGLDVALEALREAWQEKRVSMDELWRYARICRVANVMRPYLESLP